LWSASCINCRLLPIIARDFAKGRGNAAAGYVSPVANGFGADLNGGWFHKHLSSTMLGFDLEIGVVAMGAPFKDADKTFDTNGDFRFDQGQQRAGQAASQILR